MGALQQEREQLRRRSEGLQDSRDEAARDAQAAHQQLERRWAWGHGWAQVDTGGFRCIQAGTGGFKWAQVDSGECTGGTGEHCPHTASSRCRSWRCSGHRLSGSYWRNGKH